MKRNIYYYQVYSNKFSFYLSIVAFLLLIGCSNSRLTPDEWLVQWNNVFNECYAELPPLPETPAYIDPDGDFMEQITFKPIVDRTVEVEEQIRLKYPDLYSYRQYPEYETKLQEQKAICEKIIYEQSMRNEEQKERFRQENEEWLKQFNQSVLDALD